MDAASLKEIAGMYDTLGGTGKRLRGATAVKVTAIDIKLDDSLGGDNVLAKVRALEQLEGWSRRASWVGRTPVKSDEPGPAADDIPLDGEWVEGDTSHRLVHDGGERWRVITITEVAAAAAGAIPVLREEASVIANGLAGGAKRLRYAIYWGEPTPSAGKDDAGNAGTVGARTGDASTDDAGPPGITRLAARFLGFDD